MPAKSKAQQKAAGAALSAKPGETPKGALKGLFDLDAVQLQSLPFRARRVVVRAGAATVVFTSTN